MLGLILGVFTVILGLKAFSEEGIPLTRTKNLKGGGAKAIGVICIVLGVLFFVSGLISTFGLMARFGGG